MNTVQLKEVWNFQKKIAISHKKNYMNKNDLYSGNKCHKNYILSSSNSNFHNRSEHPPTKLPLKISK